MIVTSISAISISNIVTVCPHCGHKATFNNIGQDIHIGNGYVCGQRSCPNPKCKGHLFVVVKDQEVIVQYPHLRVSFNRDNIPQSILKTFDEIITCHSERCYVAAGIMVRRILEEICEERGSKGKDLKDRIRDLRTKIVLPQELLDAMDELRLLGNDAAHIEAKTYNSINKQEIDVAIEFTIEFLKALYQYSSLLDKLRSLKKQITT